VTLQEQLDLLKQQNVPLPLVGTQEIAQAMRLRRAGVTYGGIAKVMRVYHGSTRSDDAWRLTLRRQGASPRHYAKGLRVPPQNREHS
jgi:hypothetical protein